MNKFINLKAFVLTKTNKHYHKEYRCYDIHDIIVLHYYEYYEWLEYFKYTQSQLDRKYHYKVLDNLYMNLFLFNVKTIHKILWC